MSQVVIPNLPEDATTSTSDLRARNKAARANQKFKDLIGPTDPKVDHIAREKLITARIGLLLRQAFFGNLATRLKLVNADEWCGTAATDGRNFYYNSKFITKLRNKEVEFLFGHEVLHVVYDHMGRRGSRDPQLYNIAADYCVNADLKRHRVGEFITSVPCLYDAKYEGWTSEAVYDDLYDKADKIDLQSLIDQMIDDHVDGDGDGEGEGDGDQDGNGKRPRMSPEEREKLRQEVKQSIIAAAQQAGAGDLPANVARMIKDATEPKMPWRELLQTVLTSSIRNDYSFSRPNRRAWHMDAIMPGMTPGEEVDVVVFLDMSGSIGNKQAQDFLGEVQGIMDAFTTYKIHIACFDTEVYNPETYDSDSGKSLTEYEPKGGGGTDFTCMFDWMKENDVQPKRLIVFTDGYPCGSWGDAEYCDTTWIIHGDPNPDPPFGTWALYSE